MVDIEKPMSDLEKPEKIDEELVEKEDEKEEESNSEESNDQNQKKRVYVKKWNAVAYWAYGNIDSDACAICTNELMVPCLTTCEANPQTHEECSVVWGQCGHAYHFHCISKWLVKHSTCPLDDLEWDFVQY